MSTKSREGKRVGSVVCEVESAIEAQVLKLRVFQTRIPGAHQTIEFRRLGLRNADVGEYVVLPHSNGRPTTRGGDYGRMCCARSMRVLRRVGPSVW